MFCDSVCISSYQPNLCFLLDHGAAGTGADCVHDMGFWGSRCKLGAGTGRAMQVCMAPADFHVLGAPPPPSPRANMSKCCLTHCVRYPGPPLGRRRRWAAAAGSPPLGHRRWAAAAGPPPLGRRRWTGKGCIAARKDVTPDLAPKRGRCVCRSKTARSTKFLLHATGVAWGVERSRAPEGATEEHCYMFYAFRAGTTLVSKVKKVNSAGAA